MTASLVVAYGSAIAGRALRHPSDLGCRVGDMSLRAGEFIGPSGSAFEKLLLERRGLIAEWQQKDAAQNASVAPLDRPRKSGLSRGRGFAMTAGGASFP